MDISKISGYIAEISSQVGDHIQSEGLMGVSKLSRRIGGLTAAIVLGIAGMGVLATPAQAAVYITVGSQDPSPSIPLTAGYKDAIPATAQLKNYGTTDGDPQCQWSSTTDDQTDATNPFQITTNCPTSVVANGTAPLAVTIPTGLTAGKHVLLLSLRGSTSPTAVFTVTVTNPSIEAVTVSSYVNGATVSTVTEVPSGSTLNATATNPSPRPATFQWYCGDQPIAGQTSTSYTTTDADVACTPGVLVQAIVAADLSSKLAKPSDPVKVVIGDKIELQTSEYPFAWNLVPGYTAKDQTKTVTLVNSGTTNVELSKVKCSFLANDTYPMDGDVVLATTTGPLVPQAKVNVTLTPKPDLAADTNQKGNVQCTTGNYGTDYLMTNITVKKASLASVDVYDGDAKNPAQASAGDTLKVQVPDDAYPSDTITYQWYCGDTKIDGQTKDSYTLTLANVQCNPGVSVQATVAGGNPGAITTPSSKVKVIYGDYLSAQSSPSWSLLTGYNVTEQSQVVELKNTGIEDITSPITCKFQTDEENTMTGQVSVEAFSAIAPTSTVKVTITPADRLPAGTNQSGEVVCSTATGSTIIPTSIVVKDAPVLGAVDIADSSSSVSGLDSNTGKYDIPLAEVGDSVKASLSSDQVVTNGAPISWKWFCGTKELGAGSVDASQLNSTYVVQRADVGCELSAQASITVNGTAVNSDPSSTIKVAALSMATGGDQYPNYPYAPRWSLYSPYDASGLALGTLVVTNWGTTDVNDLSCSLPDDTVFDVLTRPEASLQHGNAVAMQLRPKSGLPVNSSDNGSTFQSVVCTDQANGIQLTSYASVSVVDSPVVSAYVDGTRQVGQTVQARTITLMPENATLTYEWMCQKSDGTTPAAPNNKSTADYTIGVNDIGCDLFAKVTATVGDASASDTTSDAIIPSVSITGADSWIVPASYTATDFTPATDQITIKNNSTTETLTNVSFACPVLTSTTPLPANNPGVKCDVPSVTTLAPGASTTVTITPQLGLSAGSYDGQFSVTYTEKGRPVTLSDDVDIQVGSVTPFELIQPTNGQQTPVESPSATPSGTPSGNPSSTPSTNPSGTPSGNPSGTPNANPSGTPSGSATPGTPSASKSAAAPAGSGTTGPNANGTTPKKIDTGGTTSSGSTGIALLGLGFIVAGALILKRRTA